MTNRYTTILLPLPFDTGFTYHVPSEMTLARGDIVRVPFGRREVYGVVWGEGEIGDTPAAKIKTVLAKADLPAFSSAFCQFLQWVADYTVAPLGLVLKMALSVPDALDPPKKPAVYPVLPAQLPPAPALSELQQQGTDYILQHLNTYKTIVLDGVTGSGKTEVYFAAIRYILEHTHGQVMILLPEIVLTTQILERFHTRFGFMPAAWHSGLTPKQRRETWRGVATGEIRLIIGARSALFLPFPNLALIIVDEEHDASYKQDEGVLYNARDMAVMRAVTQELPVLLCSATPSLETVQNIENQKFHRITLPSRFGGATMPDIEVLDMRQEPLDKGCWISPSLRKALAETLADGKQSMLYLNRRGYAPLTLCRHCGHRLQCPHCTSWLVEHRSHKHLQCHHCGYTRPIPKTCPECDKADSMVACGPGVERIAEEVADFLPQARVGMMTSDTITTAKDAALLMEQITSGAIDIIIGTQMIAKGHHFPRLTLVGIVDADIGLAGGDLRAAERTYQLLHQVSGRAGREKDPGKVMIQSYMPESSVLKALASSDRDGFIHQEIQSRKRAVMPPFSRLAGIIVSGKEESQVIQTAKLLAQTAPHDEHFIVLGPAPAPLAYIRSQHRYRLLIKASRTLNLQKALRFWIENTPVPSSVRVKVDVDPYSFL